LGYCKDIVGIWDTVSNIVSMLQDEQSSTVILAGVEGSYVLHTSPGPTQPPNHCVSYICYIQHEANQSPPSTAEVKNELSYTANPVV